MKKEIFEEQGGPHRGHAAGDTDIEKQASQLASDVKYKVKKMMSGVTRMTPAQVSQAYLQQLAKSPAPSMVKALAKKVGNPISYGAAQSGFGNPLAASKQYANDMVEQAIKKAEAEDK